MSKRGGVSGLLLCALLACGGKARLGDGGGGAGVLTGAAGAAGAAGTGSAGAGGSGGSTDGGGATGGQPTAAELQGGWYALGTVVDAGLDTVTHKRIRFEGNRYAVVYNTRLAYCAEIGTFQVTAAGVEFTFEKMLGVGQIGVPCLQGTSHTERVSGTAVGFALDFQGIVTSYARIRSNVPKMFATIERHDGAFGSDATLTGDNAIEKADDFCDKSVARPDGGRYRAILWDDVNRAAPPGATWFLPPKTTYFQADGVRNMFTTDADGYGNALQPAISDSDPMYFWAGGGCNGWTSRLMAVGATVSNAAQSEWVSNVLSGCNITNGIFCASEASAPGGVDGGVDGGGDAGSGGADAGTLSLQGSWRRIDSKMDTERLRFDGETYVLVWSEEYAYCGEVGTFAAAGAGGVRFTPVREEGFGRCLMRDDHIETLTVSATGITLLRGGEDAHYVRATENVAKIFLTPEQHHGDFAHDAKLAGANAIAKADSFCNGSIAKPDGQRYKAILADGTNRNALPAIDWVLKPSTTYYQAAGVRPIFTSDAQGIFDPTVLPTNPFLPGFAAYFYLWDGVGFDFLLAYDTCQEWTSSSATEWGDGAEANTGVFAGNGLRGQCSYRNRGLICVSQ